MSLLKMGGSLKTPRQNHLIDLRAKYDMYQWGVHVNLCPYKKKMPLLTSKEHMQKSFVIILGDADSSMKVCWHGPSWNSDEQASGTFEVMHISQQDQLFHYHDWRCNIHIPAHGSCPHFDVLHWLHASHGNHHPHDMISHGSYQMSAINITDCYL